MSTEDLEMVADGDEVRTTWRMSKAVLKRLKQYALDKDMTVTDVANQAFEEFLKKRDY
jgi:hypothetical protein